jgi:ABC-type nitrate/sulfonate/bicarbonate transport system permease component
LSSSSEHPTTSGRLWEFSKKLGIFVTSLIVLLILWYYLAILSNPIILPTPQAVGAAVIFLFQRENLFAALLSMLWILGLGFGLSAATGIPIALTMGRVKILDQTLDPYMTAFYVLPRVALIPLFIIWFGFAEFTEILFVWTFALFPIILVVVQGVKNTDKLYIEIAKVGCAKEWQIFTKVIIPYSAPYIFAGLRLGLIIAFIGVVIAQLEMVVSGVGQLLLTAQEFFRTDEVLAILLVLAVLGYVLSEALKQAELWATRGQRLNTFGAM